MAVDQDRYFIAAREGHAHFTEKGSKFIGVASFAASVEDAATLLDRERRRYHDATHHCYAWQIGADEKFSDDGEPSGSAGRPILDTIKGSGLEQLVVIVTRYFGGTKLGTGGLVRAYSQCAREAIEAAGRNEQFHTRVMNVSFDHADTSPVHHIASRFDARQVGAAYGERVALRFELKASRVDEFTQSIIEATHGRATVDATSV